MNQIRAFLILGLLLILAACQAQSASVPGMAPPGVTLTPAPTRIVTLVAETALTQTAPPVEPTDPKVLPTLPSDPNLIQATAEPSPTADLAAAVVAAGVSGVKDSSASPDGRWLAEVIRYECVRTGEGQENAYEVLRLTDAVTKDRQDIAGQLQNCGGVGAVGLGQLSWSKNNRYLYYTDAVDGSPDGMCGYWQRPLFAYHLETGAVFHLGQGAPSPGGQKMAFWIPRPEREEAQLVIWDVEEGETGRFLTVEWSWSNGPIAWSPDGSELAYLRTENACSPWGETVAGTVDTVTGEETILVRSAKPAYTGLTWQDPQALTLRDENNAFWTYDLAAKELRKK